MIAVEKRLNGLTADEWVDQFCKQQKKAVQKNREQPGLQGWQKILLPLAFWACVAGFIFGVKLVLFAW